METIKKEGGLIELNENYAITSDSNNWILHYNKNTINDKGKVVTSKDTWYFSKLTDLLSRYLDLRLKDNGLANDIFIAISNAEKEIKQAIEKAL